MGFHRPLAGIAAAMAATIFMGGCAASQPAGSESSSSSASGSTSAVTSAEASSPPATPSQPGDTPATSPSPTQAPRTENWTALKAGDCLADLPPTDPAVVTVTLVDCSQPHLAETYLRAPIPVDAALDGTASNQCEAGFVQYTGRASAGGPYTTTYLIDSDQDRTYNNPLPSTVICLLQGAQGQSLTGSAHR